MLAPIPTPSRCRPSDANGATGTASFTVDVIGANDAPTLAAVMRERSPIPPATTVSTITGTLVGADLDSSEAASLHLCRARSPPTASCNSSVGDLYGSLTVDERRHQYSYVANAAAINALQAGAYVDTFTVQVTDVNGAAGTTSFTVNVTGANDAPLFAGDDLAATYHAGGNTVAIDNVSASDLTATARRRVADLDGTLGGHTGDTLHDAALDVSR